MNKVILMGRLTADPEIRSTQTGKKVATYTLAVDRPGRKEEGQQTADFLRCMAWDKRGDFAEMYLHKGTKILVVGRIQTGSYKNRDGATVYTTDIVVDEQEFAESKKAQTENAGSGAHGQAPQPVGDEGFMNIPDNIDEELPFH